jgi:hypothetical protein
MESSPQRLKPNSLQTSYVRPKGRTLQVDEFPQLVKPGHKLLPLAENQVRVQDKKRSKGFARLIRPMYAWANMGHPSWFYSG